MPVSYTIEKGYAHCRAVGTYSFDETYRNYKAALDDPLFLPGYHLLMDVYDSEETRSSKEMELIAELLGSHPRFGKKCALLVNPDHTVRFGLGRMLSTISELKQIDMSIFFNIEEAILYMIS
ncbi:MAG: hypothetical protein C4581_08120 [Nitrospiraceae bacterium]|nr:MAG: hypothetical protein C4581_08120 [Nitrospiraceae bacterium]